MMTDKNRKPLPSGTEMILENGDKVTLGEVIGYGGSAIIYKASYKDDHTFLYAVKEIFPVSQGCSFERSPINAKVEGKDEHSKAILAKQETLLETEKTMGERIAKDNSYVIRIIDILNVKQIVFPENGEAIDFSSKSYALMNYIGDGLTLEQVVEKCKSYEALYYKDDNEESLKIFTVLSIVQSVLFALQRIHNNKDINRGIYGYIHGDIQPNNILFLDCHPENNKIGMACLLDFGCTRPLEDYIEIESEKIEVTKKVLSEDVMSTDGFKAPEIRNNSSEDVQLSCAADIYAVGRLFWYLLGGNANVQYQYHLDPVLAGLMGANDCQRKINTILNKALAMDWTKRYRNVEEMLEDIGELYHNTQPMFYKVSSGLHVYGYYSYREREIAEIEKLINEPNTPPIYLYGFGGIGKTTLAALFERHVKNKGGDVVSVVFTENLRKTIANLKIDGYESQNGVGKEKTEERIYKDKMTCLHPGTILIVDNFFSYAKSLDELRDEDTYMEIIDKGVKILFTTRYQVSTEEGGYEVKPLGMNALLDLMKQVYSYRADETEFWRRSIIDLVQENTYMVFLIAKALKSGNISVEQMYHIMAERKIDNAELPKVSDMKDIPKTKRLAELLELLYDISILDQNEKIVLCHALLIPDSGINRDVFLKCEKNLQQDLEDAVYRLAERGWLLTEIDEKRNTYKVHSLIKDVIVKQNENVNNEHIRFIRELSHLLNQDVIADAEPVDFRDCYSLAIKLCSGEKKADFELFYTGMYRFANSRIEAAQHFLEQLWSRRKQDNDIDFIICLMEELGHIYERIDQPDKWVRMLNTYVSKEITADENERLCYFLYCQYKKVHQILGNKFVLVGVYREGKLLEFDDWKKEIVNLYENDDEEWLVPLPELSPMDDDLEISSLEDQIKLIITELDVTESLSQDSLAAAKSKNNFNFEETAVGRYSLVRIAQALQMYPDSFKAVSHVTDCILTNFTNSFSALKRGDMQGAFTNCMAGLKLILGNAAWDENVGKSEETEELSVVDNITEQQGGVPDNACEELYGLDELGTVLMYKIYAYMCADSDETYHYFKQQADALYGDQVWMFELNAGVEYFRKAKYDKAIGCLKNAAELRKKEFELEKVTFIDDCIRACEIWWRRSYRLVDTQRLYAILCWCIRMEDWDWKPREQHLLYYVIAETCCKYGNKMESVTYYNKGKEVFENNEQFHKKIADLYFESHDYKNALKEYIQAIDGGRQFGSELLYEEYLRVGDCEMHLNEKERALRAYQNALKEYNKVFVTAGESEYQIHLKIAEAARKLNDYICQAEHLKKAALIKVEEYALKTDYDIYEILHSWINLGNLCMDEGRNEEAIKYYIKAAEFDNGNVKSFPAEEKDTGSQRKIKGEDFYSIGKACYEEQRYTEGKTYLEKAYAVCRQEYEKSGLSDRAALCTIIECCNLLKEYSSMKEYYDDYLAKIEPEQTYVKSRNQSVLRGMESPWIKAGDRFFEYNYSWALEYYDKAFQMILEKKIYVKPCELYRLYMNMGNAYLKRGNYQKALLCYRISFGIADVDIDAEQMETYEYLLPYLEEHLEIKEFREMYISMCGAYQKMKNYEKAIIYIDKAALAFSVYFQKQPAVENIIPGSYQDKLFFKKAMKLAVEYGKMTEVLKENNKTEEAEECFNIIINIAEIIENGFVNPHVCENSETYIISPHSVIFIINYYGFMGVVYEKKNNPQPAQDYYMKAVELGEKYLQSDETLIKKPLSRAYRHMYMFLNSEKPQEAAIYLEKWERLNS
jgi:tetratricopeptide (TPR) repeat protein/serine/threonine protein kinase